MLERTAAMVVMALGGAVLAVAAVLPTTGTVRSHDEMRCLRNFIVMTLRGSTSLPTLSDFHTIR
jgi:hypothetical protein